ncbi:12518_t:CDS:2, partial [Funneliformis geosporum]
NFRHFAIFSGWIDKKENKVLKSSYSFDLLYRASRDGNTPTAFHQKCDNKGANIVVIKIKGTEQIAGGYNPFGWEGNSQWKSTKDSFMFSFVNRTNVQTAKKTCEMHIPYNYVYENDDNNDDDEVDEIEEINKRVFEKI